MRKYALCTLTLIAFLLSGCASVTTPQSPDQAVYAAWGTYAGITQTTADLVESGTLTQEQGREIQSRLSEMRPVLESARAVVRNGDTPSETRMEAVRAVQEQLLEIQSNLQQEAAK